jgi:hypothetical protein
VIETAPPPPEQVCTRIERRGTDRIEIPVPCTN